MLITHPTRVAENTLMELLPTCEGPRGLPKSTAFIQEAPGPHRYALIASKHR